VLNVKRHPNRRHDQQLVSALEVLTTRPPRPRHAHLTLARRDGLSMGNLGERSYDNARSGHLRAPAQIQVLAEGGDEWIKATKCGKEVERTRVTPPGATKTSRSRSC